MMRRAWSLALALLAAACAHAPQEPGPAPAPPPAARAVPADRELAEALQTASAYCYDPEGIVDCAAPPREIRIHAARCVPIAPEEAQLSAACRLDWTEIMDRPGRDRAHHGDCIRFILLDIEGAPGRNFWAVRYTPPGHACEVPAG